MAKVTNYISHDQSLEIALKTWRNAKTFGDSELLTRKTLTKYTVQDIAKIYNSAVLALKPQEARIRALACLNG